MTKPIFLTICSVLFTVNLTSAQQDPYYSHSNWNKQSFNPAVVGVKDDHTCITVVGHKQWVGFQDHTLDDFDNRERLNTIRGVAPQTFNLIANTQLHLNDRKIGGVGISMTDDRLGFTKATNIRAQGSFFINLGQSQRLALGLDVGWINFGFDNPTFRARQLNDPNVPVGGSSQTKTDIGVGFLFSKQVMAGRRRNFQVGGAMTHVNSPSFRLTGKNFALRYQTVPHYYLHSEITFLVPSGATKITPFVLMKYNSEIQFDASLVAERNNRFNYGVGYRQGGNSDAVLLFLGIRVDNMRFGYSYDVTTSKVRTVSAGTHELAVKWCIVKYKNGCTGKDKNYFKTIREL